MVGTLIPVYSGYGDTLLLRLPGVAPNVNPRFWLIDGGPITSSRTVDEGEKNAYQQYLKLALARYCRQNPNSHEINLLEGIVVTHPDADHIDGELLCFRSLLFGHQNPLALISVSYRYHPASGGLASR